MKPPNWDRIQDIYHAALALSSAERDAFVEKECAGNTDCISGIKSLLKARESNGGVLDEPICHVGFVPDDLSGTIIDKRYRVETKLGPGGMSQVYLAIDLDLNNQQIVVKILSEALVHEPDARRRFEKEVEALVRLDHQNIIKVLNRGELPDGRPYIVMPYVKGETLRSQISRQGMSFDRAASILKQIGAALDHVHANQIFHRDLKPENVMLRRDTDSVVIIDFGIAKVRNSLVAPSTVNGAAIGTLLYMSPEQLRGEQVTAASDIYSMAVVAYEMVTGRLPFNPASPAELLEMQRAGVRVRPLHLRQKLPLQADRLITRALRFDPHRRYQNAADYGDRLAHALLEPLKPSRISNRAKVFASMLILAALAYGLWRYTDRPVHLRTPTRAFTYWLMVQRMRNGHEYQAPFKSNGEDIFESGDKFQLNLFSPEPGYLYVFYERPPQATDNSFVMLYPRSANGGVATLGANQPFQSDWITFQGPAGDENLWIIWSVSPVTQLESAQTEALKHSGEGITGDNLIALKDFLRAAQRESDVMVSHYKAEQKAVARGRGELLITLAQFKHW